MKSLKVIIPAALALASLADFSVAAQTPPQASGLAPEIVSPGKPTGLALEIAYPDKPPQYIPVPARTTSLHPSPIPWQSSGWGMRPPDVTVACDLHEQGVGVEVFASANNFPEFRTLPLATLWMRENERAVVQAAARVGRTPFQIAVVRVRPFALETLSVNNRTASLEVVQVEPRETTFPSYKLTLRNKSDKSVIAISVSQMKYQSTISGFWSQVSQRHSLIKPGGMFVFGVETNPPSSERESNGQMTVEGLVPTNLSNLEIEAAVFDDGSYEGDPGPAAEQKAMATGEQFQLRLVLAALEDEAVIAESFGPAHLERLRARVAALAEEPDEAVVAELMNREKLPTIINRPPEERAKELIKSGLSRTKRNLLSEIESARAAGERNSGRPVLWDWLKETKRRYEEWNAAVTRLLQ
jgi:hypothetical protein